MTIISIILNFVTIAIVVYALVFQGEKLEIKKTKPPRANATDVYIENEKDPLVVSRSYFTDDRYGNIGNFGGYSVIPEDHWLNGLSLSHEESDDEGSK
jgi:hypothetical protein